MWSEDTAIGDVATMRGTADVFARRAESAKSAEERERFLQYASLYREMAEQIETNERDEDEEP
ncbi:MAG: hypothetical protein ACREFI_06805 [Stellaceae bacterium]